MRSVALIKLLRCERHFGDGKVAVVRVYVPGVFKRIEVYAVAVLAEVFVLDMARIKARDGLYHLKRIAVDVGTADGEAVHIVYHRSLAETDETLRVRGSKSRHCTRCDAVTDVTVIPPTGGSGEPGDLDGDGDITMKDVLRARRIIAGLD